MITNTDENVSSPWLQLRTARAAYAKRGGRFLPDEVRGGRLRAAPVGGRGGYLTRGEWVDKWLTALATPVIASARGRRVTAALIEMVREAHRSPAQTLAEPAVLKRQSELREAT